MDRVKHDFAGNVLPTFLEGAKVETSKCYEPIHCGIFLNFISFFVGYSICPDAISDPENPLSKVVKKLEDDSFEYAAYYILPKTAAIGWNYIVISIPNGVFVFHWSCM